MKALSLGFRVLVVVGWIGLSAVTVLVVAREASGALFIVVPYTFLAALAMGRVALAELASHDMEVRLEPRDLWIGVFWDRREDGLHVYVCFVPGLVFHAYPTQQHDQSPPVGEGQ